VGAQTPTDAGCKASDSSVTYGSSW
jgi:hypothetical protein